MIFVPGRLISSWLQKEPLQVVFELSNLCSQPHNFCLSRSSTHKREQHLLSYDPKHQPNGQLGAHWWISVKASRVHSPIGGATQLQILWHSSRDLIQAIFLLSHVLRDSDLSVHGMDLIDRSLYSVHRGWNHNTAMAHWKATLDWTALGEIEWHSVWPQGQDLYSHHWHFQPLHQDP